ncbi:MAG: MFS transporter [Candidatus Thorarchaeota archaeon]|nr:MAG: MFS transporter [Candidatus Thorarchaeota archaeon]
MTPAPMTDKEPDPALVFGAASFLNDAGSDMIAPIWPTFLKNQLGLNLTQIGIVDGMALAVTALSKLAAGYASDRLRKRKPFIVSGYLVSMLARLTFIFSTTFWQILFLKAMDRLGKMRGPPRDAIVAAHSGEARRGKAFGILRAMDSAGAVVGATISFVLFMYLGYFWTFILAAIPGSMSVILVALLVRERPGKSVFKGLSFRGLNRDLKIFLVASVTLALATYSYSFLILFCADFGYTEVQLPLLYILYAAVYAVSAYPFGSASDRFGRKTILVVAFVLLALTSLWAHLVVDWLTAIPLMVFFGLSAGALDPVQTSFVSDLVEDERRASIIGAFQMILGITALPAGALLGWTWDNLGHLATFQVSLVLAVVATVMLFAIGPRSTAAARESVNNA